MALAHDGCSLGLHGDAHLGDIDGKKRSTAFPRQDATRLDRLPAPGIKAKDAVGFRDRKPAFDIREVATIGRPRANVPAAEATPQRLHLLCCETHYFVLTLKTGSGLERVTPSMSVPSLSSLSN